MPHVSVVDYGVGNLRSVRRGLEKSGAQVQITHTARDLINSDAIILPGVGAFGEAIKNITPLSSIITQLMKEGKPILGICLGLQILFTKSYEGGSTNGLNLISGKIIRLPDSLKIPQMGWNTINVVKPNQLLEDVPNHSYTYFVHAYISQPREYDVIVATTKYGVTFPSIIVKKNLYATQFHPEKSGKTGSLILRNFVKIVKR